jgi:hypothetical protein
MTYFGYTAMCEQTAVPQLVTDLAAAEEAGFRLLRHVRPLLPVA